MRNLLLPAIIMTLLLASCTMDKKPKKVKAGYSQRENDSLENLIILRKKF